TQRCTDKAFGPARSRSYPNSLCRWLKLGRHGREAWAFASLLLVARDLALLHSASRGRDLPESSYAARGRAVSMGQAWVQRVRRFHRGVESVVALHHRNRIGRNVRHDQYLLRHWRNRGLDAE